MIRRHATIHRRTRLRQVGRFGKLRAEGQSLARAHYLARHGCGEGVAPCQSCEVPQFIGKLDMHHKRKRSQQGGEELENKVALCRVCHSFIHQSRIAKYLVQAVEDSAANVDNGMIFEWSPVAKEALAEWKRKLMEAC